MRIFIVFILLSVLHISTVFAVKYESNAIVYKTVKKTTVKIKQSSIFSKKEFHSFAKELSSESTDRINQIIGGRQTTIAINNICSVFEFDKIENPSLKNFENTITFSYQFIFNCLYPKHTFW